MKKVLAGILRAVALLACIYLAMRILPIVVLFFVFWDDRGFLWWMLTGEQW